MATRNDRIRTVGDYIRDEEKRILKIERMKRHKAIKEKIDLLKLKIKNDGK